jgi:hypothetical protein
MDLSRVNEEIKIFNRKMHKIMKLENNVKILDIKLDRSCYTRHGLHLNVTGKEKVRDDNKSNGHLQLRTRKTLFLKVGYVIQMNIVK